MLIHKAGREEAMTVPQVSCHNISCLSLRLSVESRVASRRVVSRRLPVVLCCATCALAYLHTPVCHIFCRFVLPQNVPTRLVSFRLHRLALGKFGRVSVELYQSAGYGSGTVLSPQ